MAITLTVTGNPVINSDSAYIPCVDSNGVAHNVSFVPGATEALSIAAAEAAAKALEQELNATAGANIVGTVISG